MLNVTSLFAAERLMARRWHQVEGPAAGETTASATHPNEP